MFGKHFACHLGDKDKVASPASSKIPPPTPRQISPIGPPNLFVFEPERVGIIN